jgi:hypothetical protein
MRVPMWMVIAAMVAVGGAVAAPGVECDTHNPCIANAMCMPDGTCQGTRLNSGSCDVPNADATCVVPNGQCVNGVCRSAPAAVGASCGATCGTCQAIFPGVSTLFCAPIPARVGQSCDVGLGACFPGVCTSGGSTVFCFPMLKTCPDIDHNPCTTDACNPATGQCEHSNEPPCIPVCETCSPSTGCQPANIGGACDDQNVCTTESHCGPVTTGGQTRGVCLAGPATAPSPTPTVTTSGNSPTPTPTPTELPSSTPTVMATEAPTSTPTVSGPTPTPGCTGDCNLDGKVLVNEEVVGIDILLELALLSQCPSFDVNRNNQVEVNELILGLDRALRGCTL